MNEKQTRERSRIILFGWMFADQNENQQERLEWKAWDRERRNHSKKSTPVQRTGLFDVYYRYMRMPRRLICDA